jgi:hypothetical protein
MAFIWGFAYMLTPLPKPALAANPYPISIMLVGATIGWAGTGTAIAVILNS